MVKGRKAGKNLLILEDVEILPGGFRNFSGRPGQYNAEGERNFCVVLPDGLEKELMDNDWNVKPLEGLEEGDPVRYFIRVKVKFNDRGPRVILVTSQGKSVLDEDTIDQLDDAYIVTADMAIRANETTDSRGVHRNTGYLQKLYVTIEEDYLDKKYGMTGFDDLPAYEAVDDDVPF